ncbi:MAG: hypothetical protein LBU04_08460 [Christensenellaceae bacterium]|jgi:hypothetical protein|nr:hypothetical protein [Christensenellaceae bacterium]
MSYSSSKKKQNGKTISQLHCQDQKNEPQQKLTREKINETLDLQTRRLNLKSVGSSDNLTPLWSFDRADNDGKFSFAPKTVDCNLVIATLLSYSKMKWSTIKRATHDNGKSKHHYLAYKGISPDGKERIKKLHFVQDDIDAIFSLAFDNLTRLIGVKEDRVFHIIWYDKDHSFYPVKK